MNQQENPPFITVREFLARLEGRLSRNAVYAAIERGEIPSCRVGTKILIPGDVFERMMISEKKV